MTTFHFMMIVRVKDTDSPFYNWKFRVIDTDMLGPGDEAHITCEAITNRLPLLKLTFKDCQLEESQLEEGA